MEEGAFGGLAFQVFVDGQSNVEFGFHFTGFTALRRS